MGKLQEWLDEDWVRIDSGGNIAGECGTSKNKKNPDRCLPRAKAQSLSKNERASTARKKKRAGAQGQQVVANTRAATVKKAAKGGEIKGNNTMRSCTKKMKYGGAVKKKQAPKKMNRGGAANKNGCRVRGFK